MARVFWSLRTTAYLRALSKYLTGRGYQVEIAVNGREGLEKATSNPPDLILSDLIMPEMDGYEMCRQLRRNPSTRKTPIILLTVLGETTNKITGFEIGVDDYMVKPYDLKELELRIKSLLSRSTGFAHREQAVSPGKVITVFSLRGGVGKSTVAVNLSVSLAQLWKRPVALLDLALNVGHVALMMNLNPQMTIANLMRSEDLVKDTDSVKKAMYVTSSGVHVLPAPVDIAESSLASASLVGALVNTVRREFPYVVIDTAPTLNEINLTILEQTDLIITLLAREMASVLAARKALDIFDRLQYPSRKIATLINGIIRKPSLPKANIERALGHSILSNIPHDPDVMVQAVDQGVPAILLDHNSLAPAVIEMLAYHLSRDKDKARSDTEPSESLARVKRRLAMRR